MSKIAIGATGVWTGPERKAVVHDRLRAKVQSCIPARHEEEFVRLMLEDIPPRPPRAAETRATNLALGRQLKRRVH